MNTNLIYKDLQFFDKNGYELPLIIASNIVIKIYNRFGDIKDATLLNGVYGGEKDENGNFIIDTVKILNTGKSFSFEKVELKDTIIKIYVDGTLVKNCTINKFECKGTTPYNISYTSSNADLKEYIKYGITDLSLIFTISKAELDELFATDYDMPFPSLIFNTNINMEKVSTGLHSVETLYFGVKENQKLIKPYSEKYDIVFLTDVKDDDIQFFIVDSVTDEIYKRHRIIVDLSDNNTLDDDYFDVTSNEFNNTVKDDEIITNTPQINICFSSKEEGVHEQTIYVLLKERNTEETIKIGEFNVRVEAEGEDERFRALFANFGIPDPITYPSLFKECDPKEEYTNWEIVNRKSKELFLTYDEIFPYVGTYKALLNAVKFLGYNDIYFREWYKDIKKQIKYSKRLNINENFNDYNPNKTYDNILESRMYNKKLNKLSLVYKINEETEELDEYNIPVLRNVYNYSVDEVLMKIKSLKEWLEKHIIALNCRIIDIIGEGVVYEKQGYKTYGTTMQNLEYEEYLKFTPYVENKIVSLEDGSANINVSILNNSENSFISFADFEETFKEYEMVSNGTLKYPFINNMFVKAMVECDSARITNNIKNGSLFVNENEILLDRDENGNLINAIFEKAPIIHLQNANIRKYTDVNNKTYEEWWKDIDYKVYNNNNDEYSYFIKNLKTFEEIKSNDYIILMPINEKSTFEYSYKEDIDVPVFIFKGYQMSIYNKNTCTFNKTFLDIEQKYILEINKGKIINNESDTKTITSYLTFEYNDNSNEQLINVKYQYNDSLDFNNFYNDKQTIADFYPYLNLNVNKTGHYNIMAYAINAYGNIFAKEVVGGCDVIIENPQISTYYEEDKVVNDKKFFKDDSISVDSSISLSSDELPKLKWKNRIYELDININNKQFNYTNLSYFTDTAKKGDYLNFMNTYDKFKYISKEDDKTYIFYSTNKCSNLYNVNDNIQFVIYSKNVLNGIYETSAKLIKITKGGYYYITFDKELNIDNFINKNNFEFFIFPITQYKVSNVSFNEEENYTNIIIKNKNNIFKKGEVVKLLYEIGGDIIEKDYVYYSNDNINFYKVLYKVEDNYYPITLSENGEINIITEEEKTNLFCGGATFRVKEVKNETITLDGIFNYKEYKEDYLYYEDEITKELKHILVEKTSNSATYYTRNNNKFIPVNADIEYSKIKTTNYGDMVKISTSLYIAKANQAYINYVLNAVETQEIENEKTTIKVENSRIFDFIDDTHSLIITNFDKVNAFNNWEYVTNKMYYKHNLPLTLETNKNVIYKTHLTKNDINYLLWRVYKKEDRDTRKLFLEVENETLSLNIKEKGIYDIEILAYDHFGNLAYNDYQAILKII